jgi:hypothetical protein
MKKGPNGLDPRQSLGSISLSVFITMINWQTKMTKPAVHLPALRPGTPTTLPPSAPSRSSSGCSVALRAMRWLLQAAMELARIRWAASRSDVS